MNRTKSIVLLGICILSCVFLFRAWAGPADVAHPGDKRVDARSLPGDNLPPFGMLDDKGKLVPMPAPPPGGWHRGPSAEKESKVPSPTLAIAILGARAAVEDCMARGYLGAATVVDSSGEARAMLSADGADGSHVFVAQRKAVTAVTFKMSSSKALELVAKDKAMAARVTPNMFVMFGAFPIISKGEMIGAIGYSGGDDEACAMAGLKAIQDKLK
ncbi:MAG TPA: heme-binding protein [Steroidobacteraceae bacterium]|nr:heme-binding protein [Steroidobacteraceae bacterium]